MTGTQCCENPPALDSNSGVGHVEEIGGLKSYVSAISSSNIAVILISDIHGYEAPKLRKIADKVAAAGYYVVVPDFFHGDPYNPEDKNRPRPVWIKDHGPDKGFEEVKPLIESLKQKGMCKIGAAGFCWGAKVVALLAQSDQYIQAGVLLHPSFVTEDDINGLKVPVAILGGENDQISPPELLKKFSEILRSKPEKHKSATARSSFTGGKPSPAANSGQVDSFVKIFPEVGHGWAIRYDENDAVAVKAAEEAHQDMLAWFKKYIKSDVTC